MKTITKTEILYEFNELSDAQLAEHCEANEYFFTEEGELA